MHNNDDFDPPPQVGHPNPLNQPGNTPTSSQAAPSRRDTNASNAAHATESAVAHSDTPSKPDTPSKQDAQDNPQAQAEAAPAAQPDDTSAAWATPSPRVQAATLPMADSPVHARTDAGALAPNKTTTGPLANPDDETGQPQTQGTTPQKPANARGAGRQPAVAGVAADRRARRKNAGNADTAAGAVRTAADHDGAPAGTPQAQDEPEAGPQDTCPATTPAAWDTSNVTWYVDSSCTLHLSGGTHTIDYDVNIPWDSLKTTVTSIHIDGDLTLDGGDNRDPNIFKGMTSLRSVATGATVHLKKRAAISMFWGDTSLATADLSNWDTSQLTDASYMFERCSSLTTEGLKLFPSITADMMGMFEGCSGLTSLDLSTWRPLVTNQMFNACTRLTRINISNWNEEGLIDLFTCWYVCRIKLPESDPPLVALDMRGIDTLCQAHKNELCGTLIADGIGEGYEIPSTVRMLALGPKTILPPHKTNNIAAGTKWYKTSDLNDTDTDCLGQYSGAEDFQDQLDSSDPSGFYMADPYVHNLDKIVIDPNGGTTSVPVYTVDTHPAPPASGTFDVTVPASILTNPAGMLFDGWAFDGAQSPAAPSFQWPFNQHTHATHTLKARWKPASIATPTVGQADASLNGSSWTAGFAASVPARPADTGDSWLEATTGAGGSGRCADPTSCTVSMPLSSLADPAPGTRYHIQAVVKATDRYTASTVSGPTADAYGYLPYVTLIFTAGPQGSGTPPASRSALIDKRTRLARITLPGQEGLIGPAGSYLSSWYNQYYAPGETDVFTQGDGSYMGNGQYAKTMAAQWTALKAGTLSSVSVHARNGDAPTVDLLYTGTAAAELSTLFTDGFTVSYSIDTHQPSGTGSCTISRATQYCQTNGWPAERLTSLTGANRYQYDVAVTATATNPATGQRIAKTGDTTGTLASMKASFDAGTGSAAPDPTADALLDTSFRTAWLTLPARGTMRPPNGASWLGGWAGPSTTYQPGAQNLPASEATSLDGGAHYTLALTAKWNTMANPTLNDPTVQAPAGAAPTYRMYASPGGNAPSGWSMSVASATTGTTLFSCASGSPCNTSSFRPVSDLTSPAPGSAYAVTATVTAPNPDDPSETLTATTTKNSVLPYLTLRYAKGGGTGSTPADAKALIDNTSSSKAYLDIADPTGLTGPSGAAFTGWQAGGRTWQPAPAQAIPQTAGTPGGTGETVVTLTATWSTVAKPTNLTAAYHHNGNTVTLTGKAMGVGGDTVTACMTDGAGETDTCQTSAPNPRTAPEPAPGSQFTPVTAGNPRVETFQVDPTDVGSISITGHIDRDTTFPTPLMTTAHVRICPAGTPAPATGDVPADCSEIVANVNNGYMTMANDNSPWHGRYQPGPRDQDHTTNDASFKGGDGYYDIWAYASFGASTTTVRRMGTPVKIYSRYHYTATPPAAPTTVSWDWSVTFPASQYTSRYGADGQHHFTARQTSQGADGGSQDLQGTLPWLKTTYQPDMPGGTSATAPDPGTSLVDTTQASRPSDLTLARPTDSMEPTDSVFLGWSATPGATTPDTGMGDPSNRTVTLSAPAGSPEADTTLHAVWRTLNQPSVDATASRDHATKDVTITGAATPWTNDETIEATATGLDGQTGSAVGTTQTPTLDTAGAYDGATRHAWTLTLPGAGIPQGGRYRITASAVGDDGAWHGASHRYAKATSTRDVTIPAGGIILHALPLTGGPARRLAALLALLLGATLLTLAATTKLRDKRREQSQGSSR
ncbi:BspA family leucine-rich repeat surface protein [Bifidobacterium sp. ESL0775]|uniref:BspA family leucine-rich repeat surface protein n=1 Tax=Bifidobacterium sp. ESL0775 TaxID=2983230 RepID=UPI0023F6469D|nr:BspA family leucine-rich repeat surface protein [Bifidobacterium sp. ESL0775]WEV69419.1 BspA family leucine-rich repeat surface protein [Bifidobacterium sp. ESL0775]